MEGKEEKSKEIVYVLLKVAPSSLEGILDDVKQIEGVAEVAPVTGAYDIIVKVKKNYITDALGVVVKHIRNIEGVNSTETLISVRIPEENRP